MTCGPYGSSLLLQHIFPLSTAVFRAVKVLVFCDGWTSPDMSRAATRFLSYILLCFRLVDYGLDCYPLSQQGCAIHDLIIDIYYYGFEIGTALEKFNATWSSLVAAEEKRCDNLTAENIF